MDIFGFSIVEIVVALLAVGLYFKFVHSKLTEPFLTGANVIIGFAVVLFLLRVFGFV